MVTLICIGVLLPVSLVLAQAVIPAPTGPSGSTGVIAAPTVGGSSGGSGGGTTLIRNPLGITSDINSIPELIKKILEIVMEIGIPFAALMIIYSGFLFVSAAGKPEQLTKARNAFFAAVIGSAIILGAYVIVNAVSSTVTGLQGI